MSKNFFYIAGAALVSLFSILIAPLLLSSELEFSLLLIWAISTSALVFFLSYYGYHRLGVEKNLLIDALDKDFARFKRDYTRLKETVETSRHKIVKVSTMLESLSILSQISRSSCRWRPFVDAVMDIFKKQLGVERASLWLIDSETGKVDLERTIDWTDEEESCVKVSISKGVIGRVLASGLPFDGSCIGDDIVEDGAKLAGEDASIHSVLCVPLVYNGETLGALNVEAIDEGKFLDSGDGMSLFSFFLSMAAMAVKTSRSLEELKGGDSTDSLTKLCTHRCFHDYFSSELRRADRYGDFLSLLVADVDDFKSFNDEFGYEAGDKALVDLSVIFKKAVREMDVLARYGGEEFAVILPQTNKEGALKLADRLVRSVGESGLNLEVSIGLSTFPTDGTEKTELIRTASRALSSEKERKYEHKEVS